MSIGGFDLESTHSRSGREHVTAFHLISLSPFHMIKCRNAQEKTYNDIHFCPLNKKKLYQHPSPLFPLCPSPNNQ